MPDLSKSGRIRDPVHGYVFFTGIERVILDDPIAQRMRYIAQSGMAQMVFPEVRSSRFSHSLGAMHLASQFFAAALANAEPDVRSSIEQRMKQALDEEAQFGVGDTGQVTEMFRGQGLRVGAYVGDEFRLAALLVEQGLRLAALFHDLGHLPFSHDFENALEDVLRRTSPEEFRVLTEQESPLAIHERLGYRLAHHLQRRLFQEIASEPQHRAVEVTFAFAKRILEASPPSASGAVPASETEGLYQWLHLLIAGELDVDRCDYVLRDTRHYGFEFASYDLRRIVDNLVVVPDEADPGLVLAVLPQGQSAAESFLIARYRMYQWGIRHHKVVQAAAALRKSIRDLLAPALQGQGDEELRQFLDDVAAIAGSGDQPDFADTHPEVLVRFVGYDDVWWTSRMRQAAAESPDDAWLGLACYRRPGPVSLWKRVLDFPADDIEAWNARLPSNDDLERSRAWAEAENELEQDGVLVVRHSFRPWAPLDPTDSDSESELRLWDPERGRLIPLTEVSPLIKELRRAWMGDIQVHAFAEAAHLIEPSQVVDRLSTAMATSEEAGE